MRPIPGTVTDPAMDRPTAATRWLVVTDGGDVMDEYLTWGAAVTEARGLRHQGVECSVMRVEVEADS